MPSPPNGGIFGAKKLSRDSQRNIQSNRVPLIVTLTGCQSYDKGNFQAVISLRAVTALAAVIEESSKRCLFLIHQEGLR